VWSRSGEHGRLGSLKAVSVLCVFGPFLFGYNLIRLELGLTISEKKLLNIRDLKIYIYHKVTYVKKNMKN
jgi:hypothetical protein